MGEVIGVVAADSGYLSDDNLALEDGLEVEFVIGSKSRKRAGTNTTNVRADRNYPLMGSNPG